MKSYELTCLISSELSFEELNSLQEKIVSYLQEEEGILLKLNKIIKKTLDSPINKKTQVFFLNLNFQLSPEKIEPIKKKLKEEKQILRYFLIVKKLIKTIEDNKREIKLTKKTMKSKVELNEIEKKLEEILND